jgi:hypothetical protein
VDTLSQDARLLCVPADIGLTRSGPLLLAARDANIRGIIVDGAIQGKPEGRLLGVPAREPALHMVRWLRDKFGADLVIIGAGGVHEPEDALELLEAGANLVEVDSGLVYSGPGLPKRINEAILFAHSGSGPSALDNIPYTESSWFWSLLLGISMLLGGILALLIAATRVVLPYDESMAGLTREQLHAVNPRLLAFMAHDRISLAGTMIAIGVFYIFLSLRGVRDGQHWAKLAILTSAFSGFGSFFLFLGFGYFDPFHAFVTAILFQFLLLAVHCRLGQAGPPGYPDLREDARWRWSLWGQLLLIIHGVALISSGVMISYIGATHVFVPEDLEFMQTTAEALAKASPQLVPLVAHDRASFGGMLIASGLAMLLPALWGIRRGCAWLWWMFLMAGVPAYAAAIGVHLAVGYTDWWHLTPAFSGAALLAMALVLMYPYLCGNDEEHVREWNLRMEKL